MKIKQITTTVMATLALGSTAMAASSGTLLLQGTVNSVNDIVVTANGTNNTTLNILAGETAKNVGSAIETSNNLAGYKIVISSSTGGELRHTVDATKKTTYKIGYDGAASVTPTVAGVMVKNVTSLTGLTTDTSVITADVTAYASAPAGTYEDTLTVSIQAN
ncbi:hypothetical protein QJS83_09960 [Bdellovibrio sp. 22V]|uniref:hypothetical protein n=1 Tax=Bdellovibrio TaxID=958 RepID=UPI0025434D85|nr:hypothetical protein [Bdellovibrio sp. 22V]WII70784.1 hypothetical protein QJS83_09960 [Bdellovibrio sp. 22V]